MMFPQSPAVRQSSLNKFRNQGIAHSSKEQKQSVRKGFGKQHLDQQTSKKTAKQRKLGGRAAQEFRLLNRHNETKEEHLPSRRAMDTSSQPPDNTMRGVLLVGFSAADAATVQSWFGGIEEGLKVACCQEKLLDRTMDDIFSAPHGLLQNDGQWEQQIEPVPRAVIFSGMTQREMLGLAEFWSLSGVDEPIFASAVPAVQQTQLRNVLKEVVDAYAQNIDSNRSNMDPSSLRDLLKQKVAARKAR